MIYPYSDDDDDVNLLIENLKTKKKVIDSIPKIEFDWLGEIGIKIFTIRKKNFHIQNTHTQCEPEADKKKI